MKPNIKTLEALIVMVLAVFSLMSARATELIVNGGFESGSTGWVFSGGAAVSASGGFARSGTYFLWLGGTVNENDAAYQTITIPANATAASLSFYYNINSLEGNTVANDTFSATIRNTSGNVLATVVNLSNINQTSPGNPYYYQQTYNLLSYAGQTVRIYFTSINNSSKVTNFRVDDVSVQVTVPTVSAPAVSTSPADQITTTSARMNGTVNPNGADTTVYFQYGLTTAYGNNTGTADAGSGTSATSVQGSLTGLTPNTTYHYQLVAYNSAGTRYGGDVLFITLTASCSYSLNSYSASPGSSSGSSSFTVTTGSSCTWSAVSDSTSWLHTSSSGTGSGTVSYNYDANTSTSSRTGHITVGGQTFTVTQTGLTGALPCAGKGNWIHYLSDAESNLGQGSVQGLFNYEASQGVKWVVVKAQDGSTTGSWGYSASVVTAAHNAGLKIFAFGYLYGNSSGSSEAAELSTTLSIISSTSPDGFIIDAEAEYEGQPSAATAYCSGIKASYPNLFLAYAPFPIISDHESYPYIQFGQYCDAVMPQAYFETGYDVLGRSYTPAEMVAELDSQWSYWQNVWQAQYASSIKPIFPICQAYNDEYFTDNGSDLLDFVNDLKNDATPATAGGYQGVSFFDADDETSGMQTEIAEATIGSTPTVNPAITSPAPGSTLASSSVAFQWSSGSGVSDYFLYVGSTFGNNNIYGQDQGLNLSATVSGLPQDGSTLYVRLYWQISGVWSHTDYTYTAYTLPTDTTPPTVSISSPTSGQTFTSSPITVSGTANDPGSPSTGVSLVQVQVNGTGGTWQTASGTTSWSTSVSLNSGANTIYVRSQDGAGNYSTVASVNVTYNPPDTTAPAVAITFPANNATVTSPSLIVTGTASDSGRGNNGVSSVTVNGVSASGGTASGANTANWSAAISLNPGMNTITAVAKDTFNNSGQQQITVTYNPPTCTATLLSPASGASVSAPPTFAWLFTGACSAKVYVATNPVPDKIAVFSNVFSAGTSIFTPSASRWSSAVAYLGAAQTYYWTIGNADTSQQDTYANWQPFMVTPMFTGTGGGGLQPPSNGQFQFEITAPNQLQVTVQASDDLLNWSDVQTVNVVNGKAVFTDSNAGTHTKRFYRSKP